MAKATSAHGGKRSGAGRKPSLSFWERMDIGCLCETKWRAMSETASLSAFQAQPHIIDVQEEQNRLINIPVKLRGGQERLPDGLTVAETLEEVSREIDVTLQEAGTSRLVSVPLRRPQGAKQKVLEEVAALLRQAEGKKLTNRMIKTCWDEFRALEREIKSDLSKRD